MKVIFGEKLAEEKWDEFIKSSSSDFGLLQSSGWTEFQKKLGRNVFQLAVADEADKILATAQVIKQELPLGKSYFYIPRGPVVRLAGEELRIKNYELKVLELLLSEIKELAKKEKTIFLRLDPAWLAAESETLKQLDCKFSGQVQPKQTLILDLTETEEKLLAQMKPKTRYNIKVAQKHGVQIDEGGKYFEDFWQLMVKTAQRDQISVHSKDYYQKMLESLGAGENLKLIVARHGDKTIAANLVAYFGGWCVYLHGASDYEHRDKMAPYLLQWETICDAKTRGLKLYDFWGVDETKWPGVTRFKVGFAPQNRFIEYVGSWDQVYQKGWYSMYNLIKRLRF